MLALSEVQVLAFAVQELALYLDTHRDDREALELYRRYQQLLEKVRAEYQKRFGPLNHGTPQTSESYQWLDDPWPWEYTGFASGAMAGSRPSRQYSSFFWLSKGHSS